MKTILSALAAIGFAAILAAPSVNAGDMAYGNYGNYGNGDDDSGYHYDKPDLTANVGWRGKVDSSGSTWGETYQSGMGGATRKVEAFTFDEDVAEIAGGASSDTCEGEDCEANRAWVKGQGSSTHVIGVSAEYVLPEGSPMGNISFGSNTAARAITKGDGKAWSSKRD